MKCPKCGAAGRVSDTRPRGETVMRRHQCTDCHYRWSSVEMAIERITANVPGAGIVVEPCDGGRIVKIYSRSNGSHRHWRVRVAS